MMNPEEFIPNERLRRARMLKGWSQAELAEQIGTSFEMVSRWERGITIPSPHYRKRLCAVLEQSAEELGLVRDLKKPFTPPSSPFVLLASSHTDAEKAIVSQLKTALQDRGIILWSSRQIGRQGTENSRTVLHEVVRAAQVILVIVSPEARSSRHVREALELARLYQQPVCGVWIEGEHLEHCLPEGHVELAALIDAREKEHPAILEETVMALEQVRLVSRNGTKAAQPSLPDIPMGAVPPANQPTEIPLSMHPSEQPTELVPPESQVAEVLPPPGHSLEPTNGAKSIPPALPLPTTPATPDNRRGLSRIRARLLIGLAILVIAGGLLGSLSLLTHVGVLGTHSAANARTVVRGGTWTLGSGDPVSLIPNSDFGGLYSFAAEMEQALYLPLFYGDAQSVIHAGAASEVPTVQNGGVNANATIWTFHMRPGLVWSDGQPYDARDVDFTWRFWRNPTFGTANTLGLDLISSAQISADHLSITFHLKRPFAPFLAALWVDGFLAPLPAHHFRSMTPETIKKSPDNLNPKVVSGPFMMAESVPGDHYTLVRNPRYYRASAGLPYLDKVVISVVPSFDAGLKDLQAGSFDSYPLLTDPRPDAFQKYQRMKDYTLIYPPVQNHFEALYFNFHNTVLANHQEVRQAMAMAVDQQALIAGPLHGLGSPLCTDHTSAYHPGYQPDAPCPVFDLMAASKLLDDNGWVKGADGVRAKGGQRLEFEYSTPGVGTDFYFQRLDVESIIQRNFRQIGIKLDIQNYPEDTFFWSLLPQGKASPPTGAVAGRYDIAEFETWLNYDPDDSFLFACNQVPPTGYNYNFYCNPALDALYTQEQATADTGVRQQLFIQIHRLYLTQFPFIVLFSPTYFALAHKGTHNYLPGPFTDTYNIAQWWCDNGKC